MQKKFVYVISLFMVLILTGCSKMQPVENSQIIGNMDTIDGERNAAMTEIILTEKIVELEDGLFAVRHEGNYGFDEFISGGGAGSDEEVIEFLVQNLLNNLAIGFEGEIFGCSTIAVQSTDKILFGRNFDWNACNAMIVMSYPENAYASISTVNMDFITQGASGVADLALKMDEIRTIAALYVPLDGMNEKGLAVSVNMIQDSAVIDQNTGKPDITTTTAIRLLLDRAATVEEAIKLLEQYDMHASMGMMVHFAIVDANGKNVVVEYIDNEMVVTETPVVTNFYLSEGEKHGIGTKQSHERYEILMEALEENNAMNEDEIRDLLDRVSKDNFGEFESTEWSIVFNLNAKMATYYHRENYTQGYVFAIEKEEVV